MVVAAVAIVANAVAALVLRDRSHDLNMRAAFWHMAADAAGLAVSCWSPGRSSS